ncbi:expansin [Marchantia polymorpha subsp. ruderalis]
MTTCTTYLWIMLLLMHMLISEANAIPATATFYGGNDASGTNTGSCGYPNVLTIDGPMNTALSGALYNGGEACGACFKIQCISIPFGNLQCLPGSIVVTATNLCPQGSTGGWCDEPRSHFDLAEPAFQHLAPPVAGVVNVEYERVSCLRSGGIRFLIQGHPYFMQVLVYNVGGMGDVTAVSVKGSSSDWIQMDRNWGQLWTTGTVLDGQALSFSVTTSDGRTVASNGVADSDWQYGQTFEGNQF